MEQNSTWNTNSSSATEEVPRILLNPEVQCCTQQPATCPCQKLDQSGPCLQSIFLRCSLIVSSHLCLNLPNGLFINGQILMIIMVHIQEMGSGNNWQTYTIKSTTNRRVLIFVEDRKLSPTKPNKNKTWDMLYAISTQGATLLYTSTLEFFKCVKKGTKMKS